MSFPGKFITFLMDEVPLADHMQARKEKSYIRGGGHNVLTENNMFLMCS